MAVPGDCLWKTGSKNKGGPSRLRVAGSGLDLTINSGSAANSGSLRGVTSGGPSIFMSSWAPTVDFD